MRTLPRNTKNAPMGDYPVQCDLCGGTWLRSRCRVDSYDGRLKCPLERGADAQELSTLNREMQDQFNLNLDKDSDSGGYGESQGAGDGDLIDQLWQEAFGQPYTSPL